ncbi:CYTH domain-containing protein [Bacillus sp. DTU_2020_1000418_1_SI_GHA_SEK_038]|uniref:CYTH domain-containing protein n=1 Tax=Bacillus sp. DTU_2020_1000418_1_SI_GHA_SEK_038 TaxID=3077585 RepID=UPI0028EBDC5E|nr:CYTH domain-containing protein [Bacillus sp. DTU_2020_1000418_1_SI_GHA_SEK_038]WNS77560.1 CYTH domain-containing protein [Bacillus sp. DTU_2020_1000418_1_SI_GHA_SEK_038]
MKNLSQTIEIELKNILTKNEFNKLKNYLHFNDENFFTQENHYFDTKDFALKKAGCALRIRTKNNRFELTLKQPYRDGLLETNENITEEMAENMFHSGKIMVESIRLLIEEMNIDPNLIKYFGSLTTNRAETDYKDGLIVLDHSFYLNKEDFEIEYEVSNREKGMEVFSALLLHLEIPIRKTDNKIMRFYNEKYNQQTGF